MIGYIDVGGGTRDAYGAGVLDYCLDNGIFFDLVIGVSSGSANCISYVARQKGKNYKYYTDYIFRKEFISPGTFLKTRKIMNYDYIFGDLSASNGESPLDYETMISSSSEMLLTTTDAITGETRFFSKHEIKPNDYRAAIASSSVPPIAKPVEIDGHLYLDGGMSTPIPLQKALDEGCDKIVLLLTRPLSTPNKAGKRNRFISHIMPKKYRGSALKLRHNVERYDETVRLAMQLEQEGKVLIVSPDQTYGMGTLTMDKARIGLMYAKGVRDAEKIPEFLAK